VARCGISGSRHTDFNTMRPFVAKGGLPPAEVDVMHTAWAKAMLLQAILWSRPYAKEGVF